MSYLSGVIGQLASLMPKLGGCQWQWQHSIVSVAVSVAAASVAPLQAVAVATVPPSLRRTGGSKISVSGKVLRHKYKYQSATNTTDNRAWQKLQTF